VNDDFPPKKTAGWGFPQPCLMSSEGLISPVFQGPRVSFSGANFAQREPVCCGAEVRDLPVKAGPCVWGTFFGQHLGEFYQQKMGDFITKDGSFSKDLKRTLKHREFRWQE